MDRVFAKQVQDDLVAILDEQFADQVTIGNEQARVYSYPAGWADRGIFIELKNGQRFFLRIREE